MLWLLVVSQVLAWAALAWLIREDAQRTRQLRQLVQLQRVESNRLAEVVAYLKSRQVGR